MASFYNLTRVISNMALHETLWMKFPDVLKREDVFFLNNRQHLIAQGVGARLRIKLLSY